MKKDIADYVAKCPNCQQVKAEHLKPGGLTQIIEVPTWKWEAINMDFVVCLSKTRIQRDSIWVIVDKISKSAHVILVNSTNRVEDYAKLYIDEIVRWHGIPLSIISDREDQINFTFLEILPEDLRHAC